jgi:hypothetical protein
MASRALLTEREREVLRGDAGTDAYRSTVRSRVRNRLEELETDAELLRANEQELYERLQKAVN